MRLVCLAIAIAWAASAAADALYRLPWPEGLSFMFIQAPGGRITTHFTKATLHAVDIAMPEGVAVLAARAGVVEALEARYGASAAEEPASYEGNFVRVRHVDGTAAIYAHLKHRSVAVAVGETVHAGQILAHSGASGEAAEPMLHFAVTRTEKNASGWEEEISSPVKFYVGSPPIVFLPRAALLATSDYSAAARPPRTPSEGEPPAFRPRRALAAGEEAGAWVELALWLACGAAALAWFWKFSRG